MMSSPTAPRGTGRACSSSTRHSVLAIGRPIGRSSAVTRRAAVDQIVVSVGP